MALFGRRFATSSAWYYLYNLFRKVCLQTVCDELDNRMVDLFEITLMPYLYLQNDSTTRGLYQERHAEPLKGSWCQYGPES